MASETAYQVYHLPECLSSTLQSHKLRRYLSKIYMKQLFDRRLRRVVKKQFFPTKFKALTTIQLAAGILMTGPIYHTQSSDSRDLILCAPTGEGKTLAYLLPIVSSFLQYLDPFPPKWHRYVAVIFAPTQELCHQIHGVVTRLSKCLKVSSLGVNLVTTSLPYTSMDPESWIDTLACPFCITTPGKFKELLHWKANYCTDEETLSHQFDALLYIVYDEVDKLVEDFEYFEWSSSLRQVLANKTIQPRQILVSATGLVSTCARIDSLQLDRPLKVIQSSHAASNPDQTFTLSETLTQCGVNIPSIIVGPEHLTSCHIKFLGLVTLLNQMGFQFREERPAISQPETVSASSRCPETSQDTPTRKCPSKLVIFCNHTATTQFVHSLLTRYYQEVYGPEIKRQIAECSRQSTKHERAMTLSKFNRQRVRILVTTNVYARGLDIQNLDAVVNFEIPTSYANYMHRVGRCARAGLPGTCYTLYLNNQKRAFKYFFQGLRPIHPGLKRPVPVFQLMEHIVLTSAQVQQTFDQQQGLFDGLEDSPPCHFPKRQRR